RTDAEATRRRCAGLLRPPRHLQRTYRGDQWTTGTPARLGPRVPQPHQLHRTIAPRGRRIPTPPTPWIRMSPFTRHALAHWRWDDGVLDTDTAKLIKAMLARFDLVAYAAAPDRVAFLRAAAGFESITDRSCHAGCESVF